MKKHTLTVEKRTVTGRKVKTLRKQGIVPANVFGKKKTSIAVQADQKAFAAVFKEAGETGIIDLHIGSEVKPALIQNVQVHPVTHAILHADLRQIDLKEKIKASVPLEISGTPLAAAQNIGVLLELLDEIEVEALPTELPEKITVDVTNLAQVDQTIKVGDLTIPSSVVVLTDKELEVVKIGPLVTKEAQEEAKAEEVAKAEAAAAASGSAEGEKPAEGKAGETKEAKVEEKKPAEGAPKAESKKE